MRRAENKHGRMIGHAHVHIDKGEMDATKVANFLAEPRRSGQLHLNQRGAHEHNPYAEIKIKIINQTERAIRQTGDAQDFYWPVAVPHAARIYNCCPTWRVLQKVRYVNGERVRPLAPVEKWEKFTDPQGFEGLTRNLRTPLFAEVVGHSPREERRAHTVLVFCATHPV